MKLTKIEKKKRFYLVEIDGNDKLYVTEDTVVRFMMTKGMEITQEELTEIQNFAQFSYGKNLALYHLSFKKRTEKEVKDYLNSHDIDDKSIPKIIANLKEDKWIDDHAYAKQIIESNLYSGDKGAFTLKKKLTQKGIASHILDDLLAHTDFIPLAIKLADKLHKKYCNKFPQKALNDKILQTLTNKGFSYDQAKIAVQKLEIEKDEELESDLIIKELDKAHRRLSKKYEGYELKQRMTQTLARKGFDFNDIRSALREYL